MNTIYKVVRSASTGKWVVASELAKSGKKYRRGQLAAILMLSSIAVSAHAIASEEPAKNTTCETADGNERSSCMIESAPQIGWRYVAGGGIASDVNDPIAIGGSTNVTANDAIAIGSQLTVNGASTIAMGSNGVTVDANSSNSFLVAPNTIGGLTNSAGAVAILGTATNAKSAVTIGVGSTVSAEGGLALGTNASASATNSVALGAGSTATVTNTVSVGSSTVKRSIINMANGVSANDAVNVSQLSPAITALGGGASINATTGAVTGPTYTLTNGGTQTTVGGALSGLDGAISTANTNISANKTSITSLQGLISQDATSKKISLGAALEGDTIDVSGKKDGKAQSRKLTGLTDGTLSSTSTDAVTGAQLYTTNQNVSTNAGNITTLQSQINNGTVGLVQQNATTKTITVASEVEGDTVDFSGKKDGKKQSRKLTGLSDGTLSDTSTDAVTGAQLYATNEKVTANTENIATNAGNISTLQTQINDGSIGLVKQNADTQAITVGGASGGTSINFAGTGGDRVLSGIANGKADSDAVTIAQLKAAGLWDPNAERPLLSLVYDDLTMGTAMLGGTKGTVLRNLANGSIAHGSMEAVNGGQLFDFQQDVKNQMDALSGQVDALNNQVSQIQEGINNGSIGGTGSGGDSASLGVGANASGDHSTAVGTGSNASGSGSTATGAGASASGDNSTASGTNAVASGEGSTANGANSVASGANSTASGSGAHATGEGSTANGANAVASGSNSTALGSNSSATGSNSVALGANSTADRDNSVSVGSTGNERQITNVAAGTERTDAANWGQVQDAMQDTKDWANRKFEQVDGRIDRMGAMSAAYSQMAFSATGVNTPNRFGVGVGMQGGKSAVAMGVSHQFSPSVNISFGGSASGSEASVGAGMAIGW